MGISLFRIAIGFTIGALPGVVLGLAMGLLPIVRAVIQPLVDATFPIPKIAILPLFIMIFGIGAALKTSRDTILTTDLTVDSFKQRR